jgi:hypothetical protein
MFAVAFRGERLAADEGTRGSLSGSMWHGYGVIRLVAEDPAARLDERQVRRIVFWVLEFLPAERCDVRPEPVVEIVVSGLGGDGPIHPPLLRRVEEIAGCRFLVAAEGE